jgi:hypothetical protein
MKKNYTFIFLSTIIFLTACSGSDDKNIPPVVSVESNIELNENESLTISAVSSDSDGTIESIDWQYVSGANLNISIEGSSLTILPIDITEDVSSVYSVTVTDNKGDFATANTNITVKYINNKPTVSINNFDNIAEGNNGFIEITASDLDNNISSITWTEISSNDLTFTTDENNNLLFEAPDVTEDTLFELQVTVVDIEGETATDSISFIVEFVNIQPTAVLPSPKSIAYGEIFEISGEASTDPDLQSLSYEWSITSSPEGSSATLINPNSSVVTLNYDMLGIYEVSLIVNDGVVNSEIATESFTVFDVLDSLTINLNKPTYPLDDIGEMEIPLGEILSPTVIATFSSAGDVDVTGQTIISGTEGIFSINADIKQITALSIGTGDIELLYDGTSETISNINVVEAAFKNLQVEDEFSVYEGRELTVIPKAIYTNGETKDYSSGEWVADNSNQSEIFSITNNNSFIANEPGQETFTYNSGVEGVNGVRTTLKSLDITQVEDILSVSTSQSSVNINGNVQNGSQFSATLTNRFSENLIINNIESSDGNNRGQTFTLEQLIDAGITDNEILTPNESVGIRLTIGVFGARLPYNIIFNLTDPITGKSIVKSARFN